MKAGVIFILSRNVRADLSRQILHRKIVQGELSAPNIVLRRILRTPLKLSNFYTILVL